MQGGFANCNFVYVTPSHSPQLRVTWKDPFVSEVIKPILRTRKEMNILEEKVTLK